MRLSEEKKWSIIAAWKKSGNIQKTARLFGTTWVTVKRLIQQYQASGSLVARAGPGRKRLLTHEVAKQAVQLLLSEACGNAQAAAVELHNAGVTQQTVHKSTITRGVKRHGKEGGKVIVPERGTPSKKLSEDNKAKRVQFATANKYRVWQNVMFTDRKKFLFRYPGSRVRRCRWVEKGSTSSAACVNHPLGLNVYAGITVHGITPAVVVAGTSRHKTRYHNKKGAEARNITEAEYTDVVKSTFLPEGARIFGRVGVSSWVLQQDNDPTHKAAHAVVSQFNRQYASNISILGDWPPNSPDLNPIENLWAWVEAEVDALGCQTFDQFKLAVLDQLAAVPKSLLESLISSMPRRMAKVIELGGERTKY